MSDCWDNISVGMKVEVENTDVETMSGSPDNYPDSFWVASVTKIAGYKALLRYEGENQKYCVLNPFIFQHPFFSLLKIATKMFTE